MDRQHKTDFRPTRDEIKAMNHYWQAATQNVKAAGNRKERRRRKKHANKED